MTGRAEKAAELKLESLFVTSHAHLRSMKSARPRLDTWHSPSRSSSNSELRTTPQDVLPPRTVSCCDASHLPHLLRLHFSNVSQDEEALAHVRVNAKLPRLLAAESLKYTLTKHMPADGVLKVDEVPLCLSGPIVLFTATTSTYGSEW
eukprot:CAMPEP_0169485418 /NCGR_PEP_ID=MMETSP1042-20121227/32280_1 /TAXON_ID=464988 /ORGANISM="Hemiselmis andersenii, Strain CCMP1180" /LENGTH=147 /DNA_ID=CAMNT_0009600515 /DNA_START=566 /DNA_END=1007 /DNA_ORIENTATION=+